MTVNSSYLRNVGYSSLIYQVLIVAYVFSYLIIFYKMFCFYCSFNLNFFSLFGAVLSMQLLFVKLTKLKLIKR